MHILNRITSFSPENQRKQHAPFVASISLHFKPLFSISAVSFYSLKMVCSRCEKKLGKLIVPDKWKDGARNVNPRGRNAHLVAFIVEETRSQTGPQRTISKSRKAGYVWFGGSRMDDNVVRVP